MANKTIDVTIIIRNSPAATWTTNNPILSKGEIGIEIDTRKFKIGDGTTTWNVLKYASSGAVEIQTTAPTTANVDYEIGTLWLNTTNQDVYMLVGKTTVATWIRLVKSTDVVAEAQIAQKLKTARTLSLSGDANGSVSFDGSSNASITVVLANSGASAGTYTKLTINSKGIVTAATQLTAADIPTLTLSKISDAGTAASKNVGSAAGQVPLLDANGKLDTNVIPALAITEPFPVANQAAMLALNAQVGDIAIRSDLSKSFILKATPASTLANWLEILSPIPNVISVNGKTGAVVLTTTDISEGTNLYYTAARDTSNFNTNFAAKSVLGLSDGAKVVMVDDTIIINGGSA